MTLMLKSNDKQMKKILLLIAISSFTLGFSQTELRKSSLSTGGGSASVGTTQVIFTVGEIAVQENTQGNIHLSEGFIGPDLRQSLGITDEVLFSDFKVFPNPSTDIIHINFNQSSDYSLQISDMNGKILLVKNTNQLINTLDLSHLARGMYFLLLKDTANHTYNVLKIEKK